MFEISLSVIQQSTNSLGFFFNKKELTKFKIFFIFFFEETFLEIITSFKLFIYFHFFIPSLIRFKKINKKYFFINTYLSSLIKNYVKEIS